MDGSANTNVSGAATEVARHSGVDVGIRGFGLVLQECGSAHQLACLAIAALRDIVVDPSLLQRMQRTVGTRETFDRGDLLTLHGRNGRLTRTNRTAIDVHGASAD